MKPLKNVYIALENIRSLYNIGSIFRTCSFFGFYNVLLVGYTGRQFGMDSPPMLHEEISKTALGSEKDMDITFLDSSQGLISFAQEENLSLVSLEQDEKSVPLEKFMLLDDCIYVLGNEVTGVSQDVLKASNKIIEISRHGKHNSLNVTTTCGILLDYLSLPPKITP